MSEPRPAEPCTLVVALLLAEDVPLGDVLAALSEVFAPPGAVSPESPFTQTRYYEKEMGAGPRRAFAALAGAWDPGQLAGLKLASNRLEDRWLGAGGRRVNLDPGVLDLTHFVLATGKPAAHRVYLGQGVYGEVEYTFEKGSFQPLPWTYPDYREAWVVEFFNQVRRAHKAARAAKPQGQTP